MTDGNWISRDLSLWALVATGLERKTARSLLHPWGTVSLKRHPSKQHTFSSSERAECSVNQPNRSVYHLVNSINVIVVPSMFQATS